MGREDEPVIAFESVEAWEGWLAGQEGATDGVWVKIAKKGSGLPTVTFAEALDGALCHGWIDSQRKKFDDRWFIQRFTPRRARSSWSKVNVGKVERLIAAGRMQAAGMAEIERARGDGRWDAAYDPPSRATTPPDRQDGKTPDP